MDTTEQMRWEALLRWPRTRCSFQELDEAEAGPGDGMILGAQDPWDRLVGQCRTEVKSTGFGIKLVWRPTPSMSAHRSLHQPESLFHTREVGQEQDLTSSGCRRDRMACI